jgi:predicted nucleic acid-binding protein
MTLVDTSVWIEVFRKGGIELERIIPLDEVATCLPVLQEVLQGFGNEQAFRIARASMLALPVVENPITVDLVQEAVELFRVGRRMGFTIRSSVDCLIAAAAIRNDLEVLHRDRDFGALAKFSGLRQRSVD